MEILLSPIPYPPQIIIVVEVTDLQIMSLLQAFIYESVDLCRPHHFHKYRVFYSDKFKTLNEVRPGVILDGKS